MESKILVLSSCFESIGTNGVGRRGAGWGCKVKDPVPATQVDSLARTSTPGAVVVRRVEVPPEPGAHANKDERLFDSFRATVAVALG